MAPVTHGVWCHGVYETKLALLEFYICELKKLVWLCKFIKWWLVWLVLILSKWIVSYSNDNKIDKGCIFREMIQVKDGWAICHIYKFGDVDFIIYDLCLN